jgi:concentrative nucleoside transporter, CNT family
LKNLAQLLPLNKVEEVRLVYVANFFDAEKLVEKVASLLKDYPDVLLKIIRMHTKGARDAEGLTPYVPTVEQTQALENYAKSCGLTEAPLVVRPYIKNMTQSELFAIMAGGTASIAGSVMAGYAGMGVPLTYLIAASFMAAPAGLLFAKILFPQTEQFTDKQPETDDSEKPTNVLEAMAGGASAGMQLALNVGAMLIAFVGLIALINGILGGVGGWFGYGDLTLQSIFGWIFKPLAYLIGVSWDESAIAGQMIGMKLAVNEFVGYLEFAKYLQPDTAVVLSEKTKAIITFALCGFANFSSIAILIGGIGGMAPNRRGDVARLGLKAVVAGTLANLMSATIAGLFIELSGVAM